MEHEPHVAPYLTGAMAYQLDDRYHLILEVTGLHGDKYHSILEVTDPHGDKYLSFDEMETLLPPFLDEALMDVVVEQPKIGVFP